MERLFKFINLPQDKANHAFYGLLTYCVFDLMFNTYVAIVMVIVVGVGKEVYDYLHKDIHTPDVKDALAVILAPFALHLITVTMSML